MIPFGANSFHFTAPVLFTAFCVCWSIFFFQNLNNPKKEEKLNVILIVYDDKVCFFFFFLFFFLAILIIQISMHFTCNSHSTTPHRIQSSLSPFYIVLFIITNISFNGFLAKPQRFNTEWKFFFFLPFLLFLF